MDLKILEKTPPWEWPKGTDDFLFKILSDDHADAGDRLLAVELAGDGDEDIVEAAHGASVIAEGFMDYDLDDP